MPSKKTKMCRKSLKLTFPKMSPEDAARQYLMSKSFCGVDKLHPQFNAVRQDDPQCTEASLEIKLWEMDKLLRHKRRSQAKARQNLNNQWLEMAQKERTLRENFFRFNWFVKGNIEKRDRATHKMLEDLDLNEKRSNAVEALTRKLHQIEKAKIDMDTKIKEYSLFETYLNEVVVNSNEFRNIQDLINRYLSLVNAKNNLAHLEEQNIEALGTARSTIKKIIEEKNMFITTLTNHVFSLQARFENASIRCLEGEQLVMRIKNNAVKIINDIDAVKSTIWNMYTHMVHSKKHLAKIKKESVEDQARYIKRTLAELSKINTILRKSAKPVKMKPKAT